MGCVCECRWQCRRLHRLQLLICLSTQAGWLGEDLVDPLERNKQLGDMVEHQVVAMVVVLEADTLWGEQPNSTDPKEKN